MKYEEIKKRVDTVFQAAERLNRQGGFKRYHVFSSFRSGRLFEYGIYDYRTKKYVHFYAQSQEGDADISELEQFIRS